MQVLNNAMGVAVKILPVWHLNLSCDGLHETGYCGSALSMGSSWCTFSGVCTCFKAERAELPHWVCVCDDELRVKVDRTDSRNDSNEVVRSHRN